MTTTDSVDAPAPVGRLASISLDCPEPAVLADFYGKLLGLRQIFARPDGSVIATTDGSIFVTFMQIENYVAPTWPEPGQLQQMHLDISVADLQSAVDGALALGAKEAAHQAGPDLWRVLIDPAGHTFCLTMAAAD
jgi:hypothetical protein